VGLGVSSAGFRHGSGMAALVLVVATWCCPQWRTAAAVGVWVAHAGQRSGSRGALYARPHIRHRPHAVFRILHAPVRNVGRGVQAAGCMKACCRMLCACRRLQPPVLPQCRHHQRPVQPVGDAGLLPAAHCVHQRFLGTPHPPGWWVRAGWRGISFHGCQHPQTPQRPLARPPCAGPQCTCIACGGASRVTRLSWTQAPMIKRGLGRLAAQTPNWEVQLLVDHLRCASCRAAAPAAGAHFSAPGGHCWAHRRPPARDHPGRAAPHWRVPRRCSTAPLCVRPWGWGAQLLPRL